jgi:hypothetical protein
MDDQLPPNEAQGPYLLAAAAAAALLRDAPWTGFAAVGDSGAAGITQALAGYATRSWFGHAGSTVVMTGLFDQFMILERLRRR